MIVGVTGLIGSGKDTIANYLTTFHGFKKESFANSLKDSVAYVFGWDREMLEGTTTSSREWREQVDIWWSERLDMPQLTPRWVLQYWGTEVCRTGFHDDIWIASLENKLRNTKDHVVISDCRFANEVKAIKNAGGITIRVSRGENPIWYDAAIEYNKGPNGNTLWALSKAKLEKNKVHASEYSSIGLNYDYHLENNGSIDDLYQQVQSIVNI
jgi:hypothetical protein